MTHSTPHKLDRMRLAFWASVLASVLCTAWAWKILVDVESRLDRVVVGNHHTLELHREMSRSVRVVTTSLPRLALANSAAEVEAESQNFVRARERFDAAWDTLVAEPASPTVRQMQHDVAQARLLSRPLVDQVIQLARAQRGDEASELLRNLATPAVQVVLARIATLTSAEEADNTARYAAVVADYREARALLLGVLAFGLATGLFFAWISRRSVAALSATLDERNRLVDMLAHEVAQPLNNASAAIEATLASLGAQGLTQTDAAAPLVRAQSVLNRVTGSLGNTLAAARLLAEEQEIAVHDCDIDTVVALALGDLDDAARKRVRVRRRTQTRTAAMNDGLMRLALRNLLVNALKYSPAEAAVEVSILDSDDPLALVLEVRDQGSGIAPELRQVIFERGVRGPQGGAAAGMGLGLFIVARVVALHRGAIEVLDNPPRGSTFRVVLPQAVFG